MSIWVASDERTNIRHVAVEAVALGSRVCMTCFAWSCDSTVVGRNSGALATRSKRVGSAKSAAIVIRISMVFGVALTTGSVSSLTISGSLRCLGACSPMWTKVAWERRGPLVVAIITVSEPDPTSTKVKEVLLSRAAM